MERQLLINFKSGTGLPIEIKKYCLEKGTKCATFNKQTDLKTGVQTVSRLYFLAIVQQKPQKCYEPSYVHTDISS